MSRMLDDRSGGDPAEVLNRARAATREFNRMSMQLTALARALTGNEKMNVVPHPANSFTDGKNIYIRPPLSLADRPDHETILCDKRDPQGIQRCPACAYREEVNITIFHEIGHNVKGSFAKTDDSRHVKDLEKSIQAQADAGSRRAAKALMRIEKARRETGGYTFQELAPWISPYMPLLYNALEDGRINSALIRERPGLRPMFAAQFYNVFAKGIDLGDRIEYWKDRPVNGQVAIAMLARVMDVPYKGYFVSDVVEALDDPELAAMVDTISTMKSTAELFAMLFPLLDRLKALGFYKDSTDEPEDDPAPPPEAPEPDADDPAEDDLDDDAPEPGECGGSDDSDAEGDDAGDDDPDTVESEDGEAGDVEAESSGDSEEDGADDDLEAGSPDDPGQDADDVEGEDADVPDDAGEAGMGGDDADDADEDGDWGEGDADPDLDGDEPGGGGTGGDEDSDDDLDSDTDALGGGDGPRDFSDDGDIEGSDEAADGGDINLGEEYGDDEDYDSYEGDASDSMEAGNGDEGSTPGELDHADGDGHDYDHHGAHEYDPDKPLPEPEKPVADDVDEVAHDVDEARGHPDGDEDEPKSPEERAEDEAIARVLVQDEFFDEFSEYIATVKVYKDDPSASNEDRAWARRMSRPRVIDPSVISPAKTKLRLVFSDNKKWRKEDNLKRGRVKGRDLYKVATGSDRVFHKRLKPGKKDYFVCLGLDMSGSVGDGHTLHLILETAFAQAELLDSLGIPFAIYGHSGGYTYSEMGGYELAMFEVKAADDPWGTKQKQNFWRLTSYQANLDGHTMEFYRKVCDSRREQHKIIMYYTDGSMPAENYHEELSILKREIRTIGQKGYTVVGVGIYNDEPSNYGLETVAVNSIKDLPKIIDHLQKHLAED